MDQPEKSSVKSSQANEAMLHTGQKKKDNWGDNNPQVTFWIECELALNHSKKQSWGTPKMQRPSRVDGDDAPSSSKSTTLSRSSRVILALDEMLSCILTVTAKHDVWDAYIKVSVAFFV